MSNIKLTLTFTPLSEGDIVLLGGFSMSFNGDDTDDSDTDVSNNCKGGNCAYMCGDFQNIKCNSAVGCSG